MLINKEAIFSAIFKSLKEKPTEQVLFKQFLKDYPDQWKKVKINFAKFNRSKQFGKTIPLQKPEVYVKKEIRLWLQKQNN